MHILPGTVLEFSGNADQLLQSLFAPGGLFLSQVCNAVGLETHTVQNWVKRGFLSPPVKKLYSEKQFCRIALLNLLRSVLPLETVIVLLQYINGVLDDESDDLIDDSVLYLKFCNMAFGRELSENEIAAAAEAQCADLPDLEVRRRTAVVLRVIYCAYCSARYQQTAERIIASAEMKGV